MKLLQPSGGRSERDKLPVSDKVIQTLNRIPDTRQLPEGFELEVLTGFRPNDQVGFKAWSVRLRIPAKQEGWTTCIMIHEKWISSRLIGEEERKVIHKWQEKGLQYPADVPHGFWPPGYARIRYEEERAKAAEVDQSKSK